MRSDARGACDELRLASAAARSRGAACAGTGGAGRRFRLRRSTRRPPPCVPPGVVIRGERGWGSAAGNPRRGGTRLRGNGAGKGGSPWPTAGAPRAPRVPEEQNREGRHPCPAPGLRARAGAGSGRAGGVRASVSLRSTNGGSGNGARRGVLRRDWLLASGTFAPANEEAEPSAGRREEGRLSPSHSAKPRLQHGPRVSVGSQHLPGVPTPRGSFPASGEGRYCRVLAAPQPLSCSPNPQVPRAPQPLPRSLGAAASSSPSSAACATMTPSPSPSTTTPRCWWRRMAPCPRYPASGTPTPKWGRLQGRSATVPQLLPDLSTGRKGRGCPLPPTDPLAVPPCRRLQSSTSCPRSSLRMPASSAWSSTWTRRWCTAPSRWEHPHWGGRGGLRATGAPHPTLTPLCPPQPVNNADFIIPVEIDGIMHQVRGCAVRGWEEWGVWWGAPPEEAGAGFK